MTGRMAGLIVAGVMALTGAAAFGQGVRMERIMAGLDEPWGLAFMPGGGFLVTERGGDLTLVRNGKAQRVSGVPQVYDSGQGGLLDIMVPKDFATSREVFVSFAKAQGGGAGTALGRGRLSADGTALEGFEVIYEMDPGSSGGRHFGSRIVEGADGLIYLTIGERGDRPAAQDLSRENGSVVRLARDGTVPKDNPFAGRAGAQPEIWSYGHRNPQGAALDGQGRLWVVEHGAQGGDELNLVRKGANYGWPVISYGRHYSGARIGEGTAKDGMEQPVRYWDPSIAPSGLMFYSGKLWPEWKGQVFVGSLKFDMISRLSADGRTELERIETRETSRVRDVREAPDGTIWFLSVGEGAVYRMRPAQ
ncbi:PQQ-dependent sugar dehydrogenase [Vannielia litorea]|uniref:Glucose/arabinose dehydrogenase, beta-propeller fold n=1 Tax=Vannielia litorea TaxID=1217970 RepID=A0A1N6F875_9RHOB|nr:PQQ-dependent sugar dehydrogenase [Vannielia litorea]SIN91483.1 Glucose/arabinose dehydrogenase, beta-propeller fold [Vannielia litorea]